MKTAVAAVLLAFAATAARAADRCWMKFDDYAAGALANGKAGWLDRDADGRFLPTVEAAGVVQAGPGPGAGLGFAAAQAAVEEVARYADQLELPAGVRLGVAWEPRRPWTSAPQLTLLAVTSDGCLRAEIELDGYSPASAKTPPSLTRFDATPPGREPSIAFMHENCGAAVDHRMSTRANRLDPAFEARLKAADSPSQEAGGGVSGLRLAGRDVGDEMFAFFSFDRQPRLILQGSSARFELPLYMGAPAPARLPPARLIVQCRGEDVDLLYVSGAQTRRFSKITVEIR